MDIGFWGVLGWCGSVPISVLIAWLLRHCPPPPPDPWPWISGIAGAILGVISVSVFKPVIGDAGFVGMTVAALAGGVFAGTIAGTISGGLSKRVVGPG